MSHIDMQPDTVDFSSFSSPGYEVRRIPLSVTPRKSAPNPSVSEEAIQDHSEDHQGPSFTDPVQGEAIFRFLVGFERAFNEAQNLITGAIDRKNPELGQTFETFRRQFRKSATVSDILEFCCEVVKKDAGGFWSPTVRLCTFIFDRPQLDFFKKYPRLAVPSIGVKCDNQALAELVVRAPKRSTNPDVEEAEAKTHESYFSGILGATLFLLHSSARTRAFFFDHIWNYGIWSGTLDWLQAHYETIDASLTEAGHPPITPDMKNVISYVGDDLSKAVESLDGAMNALRIASDNLSYTFPTVSETLDTYIANIQAVSSELEPRAISMAGDCCPGDFLVEISYLCRVMNYELPEAVHTPPPSTAAFSSVTLSRTPAPRTPRTPQRKMSTGCIPESPTITRFKRSSSAPPTPSPKKRGVAESDHDDVSMQLSTSSPAVELGTPRKKIKVSKISESEDTVAEISHWETAEQAPSWARYNAETSGVSENRWSWQSGAAYRGRARGYGSNRVRGRGRGWVGRGRGENWNKWVRPQ